MGSLSTLVPHRERSTVQAITGRLYRAAREAGDGSAMCRRVCFVVAACASHAPLDRLSLLVRYALWSVVLDDRLDGPGPDPAALGELRRAVAAAISSGHPAAAGPPPAGPPPADPFLRELSGIVGELADCDPAGAWAARFGESLLEAVDAAIDHTLLGQAVAAGHAPPPSAEEYLAVGARTINYHSFGYGLLAVAADPPRGPELAAVDRALGHGAAAVRLANDLRSLDRDRAEATINVLGLPTATGAAMTQRAVADAIDRRTREHDAALSVLGSGPTSPAGMLLRSLRLSVGLYRRTDLR